MTVTQIHAPTSKGVVDYSPGRLPPAFPIPQPRQLPPQEPSYTTQAMLQPAQTQTARYHSRTRTSSSSALPHTDLGPSPQASYYPFQQPQELLTNQPRPSSITPYPTTASPTNSYNMQRQGTTGSSTSAPRRSTSSRSSITSASYVALMRKQKATVWCDRAQNIDQNTATAQKAAKQRALLAIHGGVAGSGRASTVGSSSVVGKIRHHGAPKAPGYVPANLSGASVPVRLSATEMLGDEEERKSFGDPTPTVMHTRSGSGRSSINSGKYPSGYPRPGQGRFSSNGSPPSGGEGGSPNEDIPELMETQETPTGDYFNEKRGTGGSGFSSQPDEDSFGELKDIKTPGAAGRATKKAKESEDLRRRGSVDERAMSMGSGVRLFVANPD